MEGLGFLVWRLANILPIDRTIATLKSIGAKWVSIKVRDGAANFNYVDAQGKWTGRPDFLMQVIQQFKAAGIEVGGWQFVYTDRMAQQAEAARAAVSTFGLSHWLVDAEEYAPVGAMWKQDPAAPTKAKQYMDNLRLPSGFPVALCTYRFPRLHRPFPFSTFLSHPAMTFNAPQVYWLKASNSGAQLEASFREYQAIRNLPMVPIGAAFREWGWEPGPGQIAQFIAQAKVLGMKAWGFWDLDEAIKRPDWLAEMAEGPVSPPPPPPPVEEGEYMKVKVIVNGLNVRDNIIPSAKYGRVPGTTYRASRVWFTLTAGTQVEVLEEIADGRNVWFRIGQRQYVAKLYDDKVYVD